MPKIANSLPVVFFECDECGKGQYTQFEPMRPPGDPVMRVTCELCCEDQLVRGPTIQGSGGALYQRPIGPLIKFPDANSNSEATDRAMLTHARHVRLLKLKHLVVDFVREYDSDDRYTDIADIRGWIDELRKAVNIP